MKKIFLLLGLLCWSTLLSAQINLSVEKPVQGQEVTISVDKPVERVLIIYRPNSQVVTRDTITAASPGTAFLWTPEKAGVVTIQTADDSRNVSVRFDGISWSGILTMAVAGTLLFGGATFAFRTLFND